MIETKAALIMGAGSPLGRAVALRLAQDGFALALCDETEEKLEKIRQSWGKRRSAVPTPFAKMRKRLCGSFLQD